MPYLISSLLLWLISLLAVFHAPTNLFWKLAIAVTEFPFLFLLLTLLVFLFVPGTKYRVTGHVLLFVAGCLFASPLLRAWNVSRSLPSELEMVFGKQSATEQALSFPSLLKFHFTSDKAYKTLTYTTSGNQVLTLDLYSAAGTTPSPCVIHIHGGSWSSGDSHQLPEINEYMTARGFQVAAINYRLAPGAIYPAPMEDLKAAMDYLRKNAAELHIDTTCFILMGRSAGGQIALNAAYQFKNAGIQGVIGYYAPADMIWGYSLPGNPLILDSRKVMVDYLGGTIENARDNFKASSPIEWVTASAPPTLLIHGRRDDINGPSGQLSRYAVGQFLEYVKAKAKK
jgi:acetyl esterase/lipase